MPDSNKYFLSELYPYLENTLLDNDVWSDSCCLRACIRMLKKSDSEAVQNCLVADYNFYLKEKYNLPQDVLKEFDDAVSNKSIRLLSFTSADVLDGYMSWCKNKNYFASIFTIENVKKTIIKFYAMRYKLNGVIFYYSISENKIIAEIFNYDTTRELYKLHKTEKMIKFQLPESRDYIIKNPNKYPDTKSFYPLPETGDRLKADSFEIVLGKETGKDRHAKIYDCLHNDGTPLTSPSGKKKYVAKIFDSEYFSERDYRKILKLIEFQKNSAVKYRRKVAFPESVLTDISGKPVGYIMKKVENSYPINNIISSKQSVSNILKNWTRRDLARLCVDIIETVKLFHECGIIIGDISGENILLNPSNHEIYFVNMDNCQIENFNTSAGRPGFFSKEQCVLQSKGYSTYEYSLIKADDNFSLAVLLFKILMLGRHPYENGKIKEINAAYREQLFGYSIDKEIKENSEVCDDFDKRLWHFMPENIKLMFFFTFSRYTTLDEIKLFQKLSGKHFEAKDLKSENLSDNVYINPFYCEEHRIGPDKWLRVMKKYKKQLDIAISNKCLLELNYGCTDSNDVESVLKLRNDTKNNVNFVDPVLLEMEPKRDIIIYLDFAYYKCNDCGKWISIPSDINDLDYKYCSVCIEKYYVTCKYCSKPVKKDQVNNEGLCSECLIHPSKNNTERICPNDNNIFRLTVREYNEFLNINNTPFGKYSEKQTVKLESLKKCPICRGININIEKKFKWKNGGIKLD